MPILEANGVRLFYEEAGSGAETVVFSHGYLMSHDMFRAQITALSACYRVIAFDHRGHGQSAPAAQPFGIYDLVDDAAALIDALVGGPVHFAGMSTGGYVGLRLALRRPDLLRSLILIDTGANAESPEKMKAYNKMLLAIRFIGLRPLLGKVTSLLMGDAFRTDPARAGELAMWRRYIGGLNRRSVRLFGRAIFDRDSVVAALAALETPPPTLVIVGEEDVATPPAIAREMVEAIRNARLVTIPRAGHTSPVEEPAAVTAAMEAFLVQFG